MAVHEIGDENGNGNAGHDCTRHCCYEWKRAERYQHSNTLVSLDVRMWSAVTFRDVSLNHEIWYLSSKERERGNKFAGH